MASAIHPVPARSFAASCPRLVRVGPYDVAIVIEDATWGHANRRFGEFSSTEQAIRLNGETVSAINFLDTAIHEVFHAIYWAFGLKDRDDEERTVTVLATAWTAFLRDNPAFDAWMMGLLAQVRGDG